MVLIARSERIRDIVKTTLAFFEGRISREELERRNREGEQMSLGIGSVTEAPKRSYN
jgi:hypothetical protein